MTNPRFREYRLNRFASVETHDGGHTWQLINEVTGHPVWLNPDWDHPTPRIYATYEAAKGAAAHLQLHYLAVEAGR
jgi:hypothetical protein